MFRQNEMKLMDSQQQEYFFTKVSNLPVMEAALGQLNFLYLKAKEKNRLVEMAMNATELGVHVAYNTAMPVAGKFDKQIEVLNGLACNQLNKLEQKFPIITKPTGEIIKATKDYGYSFVSPVISNIHSVQNSANEMAFSGGKKLIDTTSAVYNTATSGYQAVVATAVAEKNLLNEKITAGKQRINDAVSKGVDKVYDAKDYTGKMVFNAANYGNDKLAETRLGNLLVSTVDVGLVTADTYLDYYCPPDEKDNLMLERVEGNVVSKACIIGCKMKRRFNRKVGEQIGTVQKKTRSIKDGCIEKIQSASTQIVEMPKMVVDNISITAKNVAISTINAAENVATATKNVVENVSTATKNVASTTKNVAINVVAIPLHMTVDVCDELLSRLSGFKGMDKETMMRMNLSDKMWNVGSKLTDATTHIVSYMIHVPKSKYNAAKDKIYFVWSEVNKSDEEILKRMKESKKKRDDYGSGERMGIEDDDTIERKVISTTRHVIHQAKWLSDPIIQVIQISNRQLEHLIDHLKHNYLQKDIINNAVIQFTVVKPMSTISQHVASISQHVASTSEQLWADLLNKFYTPNNGNNVLTEVIEMCHLNKNVKDDTEEDEEEEEESDSDDAGDGEEDDEEEVGGGGDDDDENDGDEDGENYENDEMPQ